MLVQLLGRLFRRLAAGGMRIGLPVALLGQAQVAVDAERGGGANRAHVTECRAGRDGGPQGECFGDAARIEVALHAAAGKDRLRLGREHQMVACNGVVQRHYAHAVPHQPQATRPRIPQRKRELAVEHPPRVGAVALEGVDNHLAVALGIKAMAKRREFGPQFLVVEDLTVEGEPQGAVLIEDLLEAAREVDEAQSGVCKPRAAVAVESVPVGSAVRKHRHHAPQLLHGRRSAVGGPQVRRRYHTLSENSVVGLR